MNVHFEELVDNFIDNNIGVSEQFLSAELAGLLRKDLISLDDRDMMVQAGIGNNIVKDLTQKKRGDKIYWLDKSNNNPNELAFLRHIEDFIQYLNATCYTGITSYEFHYALYEEGSFYHRHKDQFKNNQSRKFSLISYLNTDWVEADGGALKVYHDQRTDTIMPNSRKAVFFKSNELEHEVCVAHRSRMSITGWLKCD